MAVSRQSSAISKEGMLDPKPVACILTAKQAQADLRSRRKS